MIQSIRQPFAIGAWANFHHVGFAANSIEKEEAFFGRLGYAAEGDPFVDPTQGIRGLFLVGGGPRIELLEALPDADVLEPWLKRKAPLYHFGYLVRSIDEALQKSRSGGSIPLGQPVPSVAFSGSLICFQIHRSGLILEFIETNPD